MSIAVAQPNPLYVGEQTFAVAIAGTVPSGAAYYAAWSSTGAPLIGSGAFQSITINSDGSASVLLTVTNAGSTGALYTTDGVTVTLQWQASPISTTGTSGGSGGANGVLIGSSTQGPLAFEVYASGSNLILIGTKNYGSVATLNLLIDGSFAGIIQENMQDGPWTLTRPTLANGTHSLAVYVNGDINTIARVSIILPVGSVGIVTTPATPLAAYVTCKAAIEAALAAFKLAIGV